MTGELLALGKNWWVKWRHLDPVRPALAKAARKQWRPAVQAQLDNNQKQPAGQKLAASWEQLARLLDLNPANLYRWRGGKKVPALHAQDFLAMASMTGLRSSDLIPDPVFQLSWAVDSLCGVSIALAKEPSKQAIAYSLYCHTLPGSHWDGGSGKCLNSLALEAVLAAGLFASNVEAERAIQEVSERIQQKLDEAQQAASESRDNR